MYLYSLFIHNFIRFHVLSFFLNLHNSVLYHWSGIGIMSTPCLIKIHQWPEWKYQVGKLPHHTVAEPGFWPSGGRQGGQYRVSEAYRFAKNSIVTYRKIHFDFDSYIYIHFSIHEHMHTYTKYTYKSNKKQYSNHCPKTRSPICSLSRFGESSIVKKKTYKSQLLIPNHINNNHNYYTIKKITVQLSSHKSTHIV